MSGHNKYSKIKHIKAKNDAQKSKNFGKLVRLITVEAKKAKGVLIDALTDNRNKAAQEIKHILSKNGFELASPGSASWAFHKTGNVWDATSTMSLEDADIEILTKLVEELEENDEVQNVYTNAE